MQLSTEDYRSLIDSVRPYGSRRPGEKRHHTRQGADAMVTIIPVKSGPPVVLQVGVRDVSRHGIGIRHSRPMEVGQQFVLCLSLEGGEQTRTVVCIVRRVKPLSTGKFEMGCEFVGEIQPPVPTDQIVKGLKKYQARLFESDLEIV